MPGHADFLAFVAGDPLWDNLRRFGVYTLLTSTGSFDTGRAITNSVAIIVLGPAVLTTLRRLLATVTGVVADDDRGPAPAGMTDAEDAGGHHRRRGRLEWPRRYSMSRMRSSLAAACRGRPGLLVVTHSRLSGATATVRIRP